MLFFCSTHTHTHARTHTLTLAHTPEHQQQQQQHSKGQHAEQRDAHTHARARQGGEGRVEEASIGDVKCGIQVTGEAVGGIKLGVITLDSSLRIHCKPSRGSLITDAAITNDFSTAGRHGGRAGAGCEVGGFSPVKTNASKFAGLRPIKGLMNVLKVGKDIVTSAGGQGRRGSSVAAAADGGGGGNIEKEERSTERDDRVDTEESEWERRERLHNGQTNLQRHKDLSLQQHRAKRRERGDEPEYLTPGGGVAGVCVDRNLPMSPGEKNRMWTEVRLDFSQCVCL